MSVLNIMADLRANNHQWPHTENANKGFHNLVMRSEQEDLEQTFLNLPIFATEKLDGTNVCKDDTGQLYSRRLEIGDQESHFQATSLSQVREADIALFSKKLCLAAGLQEELISRCLVYGELMCNFYYDYKERGLQGQWFVFGACLVVKQDLLPHILQTFRHQQFSAVKHSGNTIQILPCATLFEVAQSCRLKVSPVLGANKSLAQIIKENEIIMKKGEIEGIIFTIYSRKFGCKLLKWKGKQLNCINPI